MSQFYRLVITLTLIAAGAGLVLSLVESATREPIAVQRKIQQLKALTAVLPEFDNSPNDDYVALEIGRDKQDQPLKRTFFRARKEGQLVGVAFAVVAADGYSGPIEIMVGVDSQGQVVAIEIVAQSETPGLGSKITNSLFKDQFRKRDLANTDWRVKKDGGEIDQITGATISARVTAVAIRSGLELFNQHRQQIVDQQGEGL